MYNLVFDILVLRLRVVVGFNVGRCNLLAFDLLCVCML